MSEHEAAEAVHTLELEAKCVGIGLGLTDDKNNNKRRFVLSCQQQHIPVIILLLSGQKDKEQSCPGLSHCSKAKSKGPTQDR